MSRITITLECQNNKVAENLRKILGVTGLGQTLRLFGVPVVIQNMSESMDLGEPIYAYGMRESLGRMGQTNINLDINFIEVPEGSQGGLRFDLQN